MSRLVGALLILLALAVPLEAQVIPPPQTIVLIDSGVACSLPKTCAVWSVINSPSLTMQVTGTFTGTLTFEATADGQTYFGVSVVNLATGGLVTATTTTGQFTVLNTGLVTFRARATAAMTGGANVTLTKGVALSALKGTALTGSVNTFAALQTFSARILITPVAFAALGTPADGTVVVCSDCGPVTAATCPGTKASCVCAAAGGGSLAVRVAALWYCAF